MVRSLQVKPSKWFTSRFRGALSADPQHPAVGRACCREPGSALPPYAASPTPRARTAASHRAAQKETHRRGTRAWSKDDGASMPMTRIARLAPWRPMMPLPEGLGAPRRGRLTARTRCRQSPAATPPLLARGSEGWVTAAPSQTSWIEERQLPRDGASDRRLGLGGIRPATPREKGAGSWLRRVANAPFQSSNIVTKFHKYFGNDLGD